VNGGKIKPTLSTYAGQRRILSLFDRALIKFHGDINLWLQYIDYAKKISGGKLLNKIFAR
jgi:U3 small nucleolar RNA-associated protein 6